MIIHKGRLKLNNVKTNRCNKNKNLLFVKMNSKNKNGNIINKKT